MNLLRPAAAAAAACLLLAAPAFGQTSFPLVNPGFEDPPLEPPPGTTFFGGPIPGWNSVNIGITWQVPWAPPSPAPEGGQYAYTEAEGFQLWQEIGVLEAGKRYHFLIDAYPLQDNPANNIEVAFDIFDTRPSGQGTQTIWWREEFVVFEPPWFPGLRDMDLVPQRWNTVSAIIDGDDWPGSIGKPMRVRINGRAMALDNARLTIYEPGQYPAAGGADYHISADGDDAADGLTPGTAWRTFDPANAMYLAPGDRVLLRRGDSWNQELNLRGWGSPGAPITLSAYGDPAAPRPVIERTDLAFDRCIVIQRPSNWIIEEMHARHAKLGLFLRYRNAFGNENVVVRHSQFDTFPDPTLDPATHNFEAAWSSAIWLSGNVWNPDRYQATVLDGLEITHCYFEGAAQGFNTAWYFPPPNRRRLVNLYMADCVAVDCANGAFALMSVADSVVERTISLGGGADNWAGSTLGFAQNCENLLIDNNYFGYMDRRSSADGSGFDFEGDTRNSVFSNNLVEENSGGVLILSTQGPCLDTQFTRNVFANNARNPWNSEINNELLNGTLQNTGSVIDNGFYRKGGTEAFFSSNFNNFAIANNRLEVFDRTLPDPWWDFESDGDFEGWGGFNDWTGAEVSGGALGGGVSSGVDPFVVSPRTWINTHLQPYLWLRMAHTSGDFAQVFFLTEADQSWDGAKAVTIPVVPDGQMRDYWVDMRSNPQWMTVATQVRIDPPLEPGSELAIDHIRFTGSFDPAQSPPAPRRPQPLEMTFTSIGSEDGFVRESAQGSGVGGTASTSGTTILLGDRNDNTIMRAFLSFDTSALPANAVVTEAQLGITRTSVVGSDPWTFGGSLIDADFCRIDMAVPHFGSSAALQPGDFQAPATVSVAGNYIVPYQNGLTVMDLLNQPALDAINTSGRTQFRIRFDRGTNFNNQDDYIRIASGTAAANRPFLRVEYYLDEAPPTPPRPLVPDAWPQRPASLPGAPLVDPAGMGALAVEIIPAGNEPGTEFALFSPTLGAWIGPDGSQSASESWFVPDAAIVVTGLAEGAEFSFRAKARNQAGLETPLGAAGSATTDSASRVPAADWGALGY